MYLSISAWYKINLKQEILSKFQKMRGARHGRTFYTETLGSQRDFVVWAYVDSPAGFHYEYRYR